MCVCVFMRTCVRMHVLCVTVRFCGFVYSLHGLNLSLFVGEIIVCGIMYYTGNTVDMLHW